MRESYYKHRVFVGMEPVLHASAASSADLEKGEEEKEGTDGVDETGSVQVGSSIVSGKMMWKVAPQPGVLSTSMRQS
ncbi:hypothetical protein SAMN05216414_10865 [Nitrosovibrio sp. Nv17]|nr:hypothetical protein SAMN05216414_10865 [Nitrosovibrio sp. Nv17]